MGREARVCECVSVGLHVDRAGWRHTGSHSTGCTRLHEAAREQSSGRHRQQASLGSDKITSGAWGSVGGASDVSSETAAQVRISRSVSSSPASGSVPTARSPEPASDSGSPSLPTPPLLVLYFSLKNK